MSKDNFQDGEIQGLDLKLGEITNLHLSVKQVGGKLMIDARKWLKYPNVEDYRPSHKGIMLDLDTWIKVIPMISDMINDNSSGKP